MTVTWQRIQLKLPNEQSRSYLPCYSTTNYVTFSATILTWRVGGMNGFDDSFLIILYGSIVCLLSTRLTSRWRI